MLRAVQEDGNRLEWLEEEKVWQQGLNTDESLKGLTVKRSERTVNGMRHEIEVKIWAIGGKKRNKRERREQRGEECKGRDLPQTGRHSKTDAKQCTYI